MRYAEWMSEDERPLGTRISDLLELVKTLRQAADWHERDATRMRREADEYERTIENLRRS